MPIKSARGKTHAHRRTVTVSLLVFLASAYGAIWSVSPARAQDDRYELGRRLRVFEVAWDAQPDETARQRSITSVQRAVNQFFAFNFRGAGQAMDQARNALTSDQPAATARQWAESLQLSLDRRLVDGRAESLEGRLSEFYPSHADAPPGALIRLSLIGPDSASTTLLETLVDTLPRKITIPLKPASARDGDWTLRAEILVEGKVLSNVEQTLSIVDGLDNRLSDLKAAIAAWPAGSETTDRASARSLLELLTTFKQGKTLETDYPLAAILREAEAIAKTVKEGGVYHGPKHSGQHWMTVVTESGRQSSVRVMVPGDLGNGRSRPLVIAMHGAGGSENLFFDGYGHGGIVPLCTERGWLLVAPRAGFVSTPTPDLVDALAKLYPIDPSKVMLVGHSMGAAMSVAAAEKSPSRFAAVAALGGGGRISPMPAETLKKLPFFIGVGTKDFALRGSRALRDTLQRVGVEHISYKEYPEIEHLVIVQVALRDVFKFFQEVMR